MSINNSSQKIALQSNNCTIVNCQLAVVLYSAVAVD